MSATRLPSLTGLRFVAAFAVFLTHIAVEGLFSNHAVSMALLLFVRCGMLGVSLFFVLSGFVLTWTAREQEPAGAFWRRRAAKICPNNVVTGLVALVLLVFFGHLLRTPAPPPGAWSP